MSKPDRAAVDADAAGARRRAEGNPQGTQPTPRMELKGSDLPPVPLHTPSEPPPIEITREEAKDRARDDETY